MTKLTETQTFYRPRFQAQGPDTNCQYNGQLLGWDSCTCYAGAMMLDGYSIGRMQPSGCSVRRATGDSVGGTTVPQVASAIYKLYGVIVTSHVGSNVLTPARLAAYIRAGRRAIVQGNADAMIGTKWQSTAGSVNHAVGINEVRGGTVSEPSEALVYDPAADGRKRAYHVDQGPSWWPWSLVKTFAARLQPDGPGGPRLGPGKVYCGIFPDGEPHVNLVAGGRRASPFPDRVRADESPVRIRSGRTNSSNVLYTVPNGTLLVVYQYAEGDEHEGDRTWGGNDTGTQWVHLKNCRHVGGDS